MSGYSRLPTAGSGASEERLRHPKTAYDSGKGHGESNCCNGSGHAKATKDVVPQQPRMSSASDINFNKFLMVEVKSPNRESFPEPPENMDEAQRLTWQTQWADALKKVQALRLSGSQSERWSGVATDICRHGPKPQDKQASARTSHASSLDRWNHYPGPSVNRDSNRRFQKDHTIPNVSAGAWNKEVLGGAMSNREAKPGITAGSILPGRGSKSITAFGKLEPLSTESTISENFIVAEQEERPSTRSSIPLDQFNERPESYPAFPSRVLRSQSHRYGRTWNQKPEAKFSAAVPNPNLKKAISMREGGAHQDAVLEMARAYTDTICGMPKTLECASCGRNLGIIVQGNPGVDIAFCQACRPSPMQWKKTISDPTAGSRKKKNVIVQFCKKLLRLDNNKKSGVLPKYFSSEWSFAQFRVPEETRAVVAFGVQKDTIVIVCANGSYYRCSFDGKIGGEMVQLEYERYMKPEETDEETVSI